MRLTPGESVIGGLVKKPLKLAWVFRFDANNPPGAVGITSESL
jgi:hypothetical protein